jgi:hypothetical protein
VQQDLQQTQQQQYMLQQQYMVQQQQYMCMMSAACIPFVLPQPTAAARPTPEPAPYGRALSTLRHKYAAEIRSFMESEGLSVDCSTPAAASVPRVFKQLCLMRDANTLPADAKWFEFSVTWFEDKHEKPFKDFIRKLYFKMQSS